MRVEKSTSAHTYNILSDDGELIARVEDEHLARQLAASDKMLVLLKALISPWIWNEGECVYCERLPDDHALECEIMQARAVIAGIEA